MLPVAAFAAGDGSAGLSWRDLQKLTALPSSQPSNSLVPDDPVPSRYHIVTHHRTRGGGPPAGLLSNFTLNGAMALEHLSIEDNDNSGCWSVAGIVDCSTLSGGKVWTSSWIDTWTDLVRSVDPGANIGNGFQNTTMFLREALTSREDEVRHKHAVIVGSQACTHPMLLCFCPPPVPTRPSLSCAEAVV